MHLQHDVGASRNLFGDALIEHRVETSRHVTAEAADFLARTVARQARLRRRPAAAFDEVADDVMQDARSAGCIRRPEIQMS